MTCHSPTPLVRGRGLSLGYQRDPVLTGVDFDLRAGDVLAVVGHNGAGKTTLVKSLLGVLPPIAGDFDWARGRPPSIA